MQPEQLIGIWKLKNVAGRPPNSVNVSEYWIEFKDGGKWLFAGTRPSYEKDASEGTAIRGKGTWKLEGDILESSLGGRVVQEKVVLRDNILEISFVPSETAEGKRAPETACYERLKEHQD